MKILFDVQELYYLAQYLPVFRELAMRRADCEFVVYDHPRFTPLLQKTVVREELPVHWVSGREEALSYYLARRADWVIFGNRFFDVARLHTVSKSAQMGHAIGIKHSYYTKSDTPMTVRFIEGPRRLEIIRRMYPESRFVLTGFAKLDPMYHRTMDLPDLVELGLDPRRKTLLYAPTFYPSSIESFPMEWPRHFHEYNLIVKPHFFSMTKAKYRAQREKFDTWRTCDNVYMADVDEHSLLPFMGVSDLLISEASSAIFEFAALDKPVVWCDFLSLRWSYRGPFRFRYTRRMDQDILKFSHVAAHAKTYDRLKAVVDEQIRSPEMYHDNRRTCCDLFVGPVDGMASRRVADYLLNQG